MHRDMIVFGEDWGRHPSSTQHLMQKMAQYRRIIWMNSLGLRGPKFNFSDVKRIAQRAKNITHQATPHPFSAIIQPRHLPFPGSKIAQMINRKILPLQINKVARANRFANPIFWTSLPSAVTYLGKLEESCVIYYAGDDFGALAGVDHEPILRMEHRLAQRADLILAASEKISQRFCRSKTHILPHGVAYQHFATPAPCALQLQDIKRKGPVAGFYGSLNAWIDIATLKDTAKALPHWQFVLIGRAETNLEPLHELANVHVIGQKPHSQLPQWSQHWDVSLLPFHENEQIAACNPLKLREYIACGKPIAATHLFNAAKPYAHIVHVPKSNESFKFAICCAHKKARNAKAHQPMMTNQSWQARVQTINDLIEAL